MSPDSVRHSWNSVTTIGATSSIGWARARSFIPPRSMDDGSNSSDDVAASLQPQSRGP